MDTISQQASSDVPINTLGGNSRTKRLYKDGKTVGIGYYQLPGKDNFAHFLGWKAPTEEELSGQEPASGTRALQVALHQDVTTLGKMMSERTSTYRNMFIADYKLKNMPGRHRDQFATTKDAINRSIDNTENSDLKPGQLGMAMTPQYLAKFVKAQNNDNYHYLEAQYRAEWANKSSTMISSMIKARHEAIRKSFGEIR